METHLSGWLAEARKARPAALIVDLDETLCTQFDVPVPAGVALLLALDRSVSVHYVTARPEASRRGTEEFIMTHRLPGWRNLHFCPSWQSSRQHKREKNAQLAKEYTVLASIGDADEDRQAAVDANIPFVRVSVGEPGPAWAELRRFVGAYLRSADELEVW